ncbi:MAG: V-type ATP synthase subunit E [Clostridia bacterium]|nr:V-type ATP synthase subunit E [Clostridia bacterium]
MEEEVILSKILEDANAEATKILEDAQKQAREIEEKQREQISKNTEDAMQVLEDKIKREVEIEIEKAELESRTEILTKKQEQIRIVKEKVQQKLRDLDVQELCDIYKRFISRFSNKENIEIVLQEKNKEAISKELKTLGVRISDETPDFTYGIIIRDGNVEYNYCFEEIMNFNNEKIEKLIANILFS